ncbi:hypothetical protein [Lacrimispora sp.]|uniref:hypothetical protein n=1 Tax=Lacrimispora sp. TaxID=2719234 RepID=UPI002FDAA266
MKNKIKIFSFAFFVLILTIITVYNHIKADILSKEGIHKDDFIVRIHSPETRIMISVQYPQNILIFNSPEFIYLVNTRTGEKVLPSEPYTKTREDFFWFNADKSILKEDYELVINKIAINVEENVGFNLPAFPLGETIDFDLTNKLKYGTIKFNNVQITIDENNNLLAITEIELIPLSRGIEINSIYGKDHVILLSRRGRDEDNDKGAGLGIFLDKSLQGEEQDIVYEKVEYITSTDFRYKINRSWKDDTNE